MNVVSWVFLIFNESCVVIYEGMISTIAARDTLWYRSPFLWDLSETIKYQLHPSQESGHS